MPTPDLMEAVRSAFADEAKELLQRAEESITHALAAAEANRAGAWLAVMRPLHTLKGSASSLGHAALVEQLHALEERARSLSAATGPLPPGLEQELLRAVDALRTLIGTAIAPAAPAQPGVGELPYAAEDSLRVRPERIDALHAMTGELVVTRLQQELFAGELTALRDDLEALGGDFQRVETRVDKLRRVIPGSEWSDLRGLLRSFRDGLHQVSRRASTVARELPLAQAQSAVVSTALEDSIRELRLMPLRPFFEEFGQVAREAARASGKEVRLSIHADGAEIDRSVMVQLREPMLHLVRNAVVHGLETPAARTALGKEPSGSLRLEARCDGTRATLSVVDDGAGVDVERVRRRAGQLGLRDAQAPLPPEEVLEVLAHPGFSTREQSDEFAGRGIGLDVVASRVKTLAGTLSMDSARGQGTRFAIEVPISASTSLGLVVRAAGRDFGVLVTAIERVLRLGTEDEVSVEGRPMVRLGHELLSHTTLSSLLGLPAGPRAQGRRPAVLVKEGRHRVVIEVDEIPGDQAFVVKPLGRAFSKTRLVLGGAIQADGSVIPVLQTAELLVLAAGAERPRLASWPVAGATEASPATLATPRARRVLVADDSLAMRTLLRGILQGAHFEVAVAADGRAALEEYRRVGHFDLVVSDYEMPHLDGIQLCQAVRGSAQPATPFVIVTSIGAPEQRRRALEAGADAWVVKADFEQGRFLRLVDELLGAGPRA